MLHQTRIGPHCAGNCAGRFLVILKTQQVKHSGFCARIQSHVHFLGSNLQRAEAQIALKNSTSFHTKKDPNGTIRQHHRSGTETAMFHTCRSVMGQSHRAREGLCYEENSEASFCKRRSRVTDAVTGVRRKSTKEPQHTLSAQAACFKQNQYTQTSKNRNEEHSSKAESTCPAKAPEDNKSRIAGTG